MKPSAVAIVTVSYNSSAQMDAFLSSVRESCGAEPSVFIADNDSRDVAVTQKIATKYKATVVSERIANGSARLRLK